MKLFPFQQEGVEFLKTRRRAFLADEPGLGKTVQALQACRDLGFKKIVVICPGIVRDSWSELASKIIPDVKFEVCFDSDFHKNYESYIISYGLAASNFNFLKKLEIDCLILDEAHFLKNTTSKRTEAIYGKTGKPGLVASAKHVYALSGTPFTGHVDELYTHLAALFPKSLIFNGVKLTRDRFENRFCITKKVYLGIKIVKKVVGTRHENVTLLRKMLSPYFLRRKRVHVMPELPPVISQVFNVDVPLPRDQDLVDFSNAMENAMNMHTFERALEILGAPFATARRLLAIAKLDALVELINLKLDSGVEKLVVYGWHTESLELLRDRLHRHNAVLVDGATSKTRLKTNLDLFKRDSRCRVFIGQIQAAGTGLNGLTVASEMIFLECSFTHAENQQVIARLQRIGQSRPVNVTFLTCQHRADQRVMQICAEKARSMEAL